MEEGCACTALQLGKARFERIMMTWRAEAIKREVFLGAIETDALLLSRLPSMRPVWTESRSLDSHLSSRVTFADARARCGKYLNFSKLKVVDFECWCLTGV